VGLGDEIMLSGAARKAQQTDPRKCRVTYKGLANRWSPIWDGNPRIAKPLACGDFQDLPARDMANNRPYHTGKTAERWAYNLDFRPDVGELYFSKDEKAFGAKYPGRLILEPHIKPGASPNKRWPWEFWQRLAKLFIAAGMPVTQLGAPGTKVLDGAEFVPTGSFRTACSVIAGARGAVLHEGGAHHAAAAFGVPAVVIMGGFTPVELTGYPMHRNLGASLGEACGNRLPCKHCAEWMARITHGMVFDELRSLLK